MNSWKPLTLSNAILAAKTDAEALIRETYRRAAEITHQPMFIYQVPLDEALESLAYQRARLAQGETLPLFGVPFAVKDTLDVKGIPTTAACPAFSYIPERTAAAVERLLNAGAILIGKTNLDQFATGLVGTRTPYGTCHSVFHRDYVSGGSSSGSAVIVAEGVTPFSVGTDTAGSGRVPAAFNGIIGFKPTRGLISAQGLVPACRSIDCVTVFTNDANDAWHLIEMMRGYDIADVFSRIAPMDYGKEAPASFQFGVPKQLEWFGNSEYERLYQESVAKMTKIGGRQVEVDLQPFFDAGRLLYDGPWVAERFAAVGKFIEAYPNDVEPTVRDIILAGKNYRADELFLAEIELAELKRKVSSLWQRMDAMLLPTTGTIYRIEEIRSNPVKLNGNLGRYTNFANLLDLAAIAIPSGITDSGLPFGVSVVGQAYSDRSLVTLAHRCLI
jgi:allophanate hydrolase